MISVMAEFLLYALFSEAALAVIVPVFNISLFLFIMSALWLRFAWEMWQRLPSWLIGVAMFSGTINPFLIVLLVVALVARTAGKEHAFTLSNALVLALGIFACFFHACFTLALHKWVKGCRAGRNPT